MSLIIILSAFLNIIAPGANRDHDLFINEQDSIKTNQVLYNGRLWRNLYSKIRGDQFLFSPEFLTGSVGTEGRVFGNVPLKYDIYNDEVMTETPHGIMIQLNKEKIDSFSLKYYGRNYLFIRADSTDEFNGYVNLLYKGKSSFIVKYRKLIELLAVDKKYDQFYNVSYMYLVRDNEIHQFSGRLELMRLFGDYKKEVKSYIRKNKIIARKNNPESFVPIIEYYDSIR